MTQIVKIKEATQTASWTGTLLIAGCCIGGGMLAMPIQTAEAGFMISAILLTLSWIFMMFTGLLLMEATLWVKNRAHFSSLAMRFLGKGGKWLSVIIYLFMNYVSLVAYTAGGAPLIDQWIERLTGVHLGYATSCLIFTALFGTVIYFGSIFIGKINSLLVTLMAFFYCSLVFIYLPEIKSAHLSFRPCWRQGVDSLPLLLAAFSYQMIVPSVCSFLDYNVQKLKKSIILGTTIPFVVYFLWLLIIHGVIPLEGAGGLREAFIQGSSVTESLKITATVSVLKWIMEGFAFFAVVTSYLGLSLALFDFIRDHFSGICKTLSRGSILLISLTPSLFLAVLYPRALLQFLDLSGGFGDALLSCLIPISIIWVGRYQMNLFGPYRTPGGKWTLATAGVLALFIFCLQWWKLF